MSEVVAFRLIFPADSAHHARCGLGQVNSTTHRDFDRLCVDWNWRRCLSFRCRQLAAGGAGNRANMIRSIAEIPLAPDSISTETSPLVVTKTLFLTPAVNDGALIALVLCDDRAFRVTRGGSAVT